MKAFENEFRQEVFGGIRLRSELAPKYNIASVQKI
jgi:hypothetical protein